LSDKSGIKNNRVYDTPKALFFFARFEKNYKCAFGNFVSAIAFVIQSACLRFKGVLKTF
jgi:hypothetical protein